VCGGGLLLDVMHDILEGALEYEMKLMMLQQFIYEEHYFTLEELNTRMDFFTMATWRSRTGNSNC